MKTKTSDITVELRPRRVIERKLLDALHDDDCVAILASEDDLDILIGALNLFSGCAANVYKERSRELCSGLRLLRKEAFTTDSNHTKNHDTNEY